MEMERTGIINGRVILKYCLKRPAPSIAGRFVAGGINTLHSSEHHDHHERKHVPDIDEKQGEHRYGQSYPILHVGLVRKPMGLSIKCVRSKRSFIGLNVSLKMVFHTMEETTGGVTQGTRNTHPEKLLPG